LKIFSKTNFLLLSGLLLVATASLDPIVHDHFSEESSEITCQFYNNELTNLLSACSLDENFYVSNVLVSEKKIIVLPQDQKNFQSRAPPKI
jgi:cytochrome c biogenesis factor